MILPYTPDLLLFTPDLLFRLREYYHTQKDSDGKRIKLCLSQNDGPLNGGKHPGHNKLLTVSWLENLIKFTLILLYV